MVSLLIMITLALLWPALIPWLMLDTYISLTVILITAYIIEGWLWWDLHWKDIKAMWPYYLYSLISASMAELADHHPIFEHILIILNLIGVLYIVVTIISNKRLNSFIHIDYHGLNNSPVVNDVKTAAISSNITAAEWARGILCEITPRETFNGEPIKPGVEKHRGTWITLYKLWTCEPTEH